jgi:hypothetical protein
MTRHEERAVRRAFWMQHLRECSMAGERLSSFVRRQVPKVVRAITGRGWLSARGCGRCSRWG